MAIYTISDLHLGLSSNKPMDIFGPKWENYLEILQKNWTSLVKPDDLVLIPGDISWAMYLDEIEADFRFLNDLPGIKLISKGNHDYWWETLSKLNLFLETNRFSTIRFVHNTTEVFGNVAVCGTKGYPETEQEPDCDEERKLYRRELVRLENAISEAKKTGAEKIIVMLHYPPGANSAFAKVMQEENVDFCVFGHLHGGYFKNAVQGNVRGVEYRLVSCDYLKFEPLKICEF